MSLPLFAGAGAVSEAAGTLLEKKILKKIKLKNYQTFSFLAISLLIFPLLLFGFWKISSEAWQIKNLIILGFIILSSFVANYFTFVGLNRESLTEFEPLWLFQPLFVIILAFIVYASERQTSLSIIIPAIIASLTLILSHITKHHLKFNKYAIATLLGSLFFAFELVASKAIVQYYNPLSFYFIRCFFVFIISILIFKSKFSSTKNLRLNILLIAVIWIFYRVLLYIGYGAYGVIFTTLIFILAPVLTYIAAIIFLKEKPKLKNTIASIIILICVGYAVIAGQ